MELGPYNTGNKLLGGQFIACIVGTRFIASVVHRHAQCNNPPHTRLRVGRCHQAVYMIAYGYDFYNT